MIVCHLSDGIGEQITVCAQRTVYWLGTITWDCVAEVADCASRPRVGPIFEFVDFVVVHVLATDFEFFTPVGFAAVVCLCVCLHGLCCVVVFGLLSSLSYLSLLQLIGAWFTRQSCRPFHMVASRGISSLASFLVLKGRHIDSALGTIRSPCVALLQ